MFPAGQKKAPDLITDDCELPCCCWEVNSGPLKEQPGLLTSEPYLQPLVFIFYKIKLCHHVSLEARGQLCNTGFLSPPSHGFQGLKSVTRLMLLAHLPVQLTLCTKGIIFYKMIGPSVS